MEMDGSSSCLLTVTAMSIFLTIRLHSGPLYSRIEIFLHSFNFPGENDSVSWLVVQGYGENC